MATKKNMELATQAVKNYIKDTEGFITMAKTEAGEVRLSDFMKQEKNKTIKIKDNDFDALVKALDKSIINIKRNDFDNAILDPYDKSILLKFIKYTSQEKGKLGNVMLDVANKILTIAKSFYEYCGENDRVGSESFITDTDYDALLSGYLKQGTEPTGIVPEDIKETEDEIKRSITKTDIQFETLNNNLNKCYRVYESDDIPDGVKEDSSIEGFLDNIYDTLELSKDTEISIDVSPKIDGVSLNARVKKNKLKNPASRGDDNSAMAIRSLEGYKVSKTDDDYKPFGIQYEVFVSKENRIKASEYLNMEKPYASCRSAAAGIFMRLASEGNEELIKFLSMYPITSEGLNGTYIENIKFIQKFGNVPDDMIERKIITGSKKALLTKIKNLFESFNDSRETLTYAIDGIVLGVVNDEYQKAIGRKERTNKFQIALKFEPSSEIAKLKMLELSSGLKGFKTIQLILDKEVTLNGGKYDHVPVASVAIFESFDFHIGDVLSIKQVGDVIPSITKIKSGNGCKLLLPTICEDCGRPLDISSKRLICRNNTCPSNIAGKIVSFLDDLDMDDYSEAFAKTLVDNGVKDIIDVINLDATQLKNMGFGKKADKFSELLMTRISHMKDYEMLGSIGMRGIRKESSKKILRAIPLTEIPNMALTDIISKLNNAKGIDKNGTLYANELTQNAKIIKTLIPLIDNKVTDFDNIINVGHTNTDLSDEAKTVAREMCYGIVDGHSFDILIVPDHNVDSKKVDRAKANNLPIYTNEEFVELYKNKSNKQ